MDFSIKGLQEAQEWNQRAIANMKPSGTFGEMLREVITQLHRYMVSETHVDTGALRASERMEINGMTGRIYVDESATNPRSLSAVAEYAEIENARGDEHAFGRNTYEIGSPPIIETALIRFGRSLT